MHETSVGNPARLSSQISAFCIATLLLTACSYKIDVMSRTSGDIGYGMAQSNGSGAGSMTITVESKTYTGEWVLASNASVGFVNSFGQGWAGTAPINTSSFSTVYLSGGTSPGLALLRAPDGSGLRCRFDYSETTDKAVGECRDDSGQTFDMLVQASK